MPNAVDNVMDAIAPPPRTSRESTRDDDGPSFNDHLDNTDTQRPERPTRTDRPHRAERARAQRADATTTQRPDTHTDDNDKQQTATPQPTTQTNQIPTTPITLQIVDAAATAATATKEDA